ncbi:MAG: nucleotide exchange factor GrpE [Chloroflexota bacterium]
MDILSKVEDAEEVVKAAEDVESTEQSQTANETTGAQADESSRTESENSESAESTQPNEADPPSADDVNDDVSKEDDDGEPAELTPEERIAELEEQLAASQAKTDEHFDRLQRTVADYQNIKRRQEKQLHESIERASSRLVERILPVLDDFDLAFKNLPEEVDEKENPWVSGFQQIQRKLVQLIEDEGVTVMPVDGPFDPNRHEAVSSEASDEIESGHIIETLRTGYEHKERVLRPALVRVSM